MSITKTIPLGTLSGEFAWSTLRGFVDDINAREPASQASITVTIKGDTLSAAVERKLTPAEEVLHVRAEVEAQAEALRKLLTNEFGRGLTAERADELRRLLGLLPGNASGTAAPNAPAATPYDGTQSPGPVVDRKAEFLNAVKQSGFKWPDDSNSIIRIAKGLGVGGDEAAVWLREV